MPNYYKNNNIILQLTLMVNNIIQLQDIIIIVKLTWSMS